MTTVGLGTDLALVPGMVAHDAAAIDLVPRTRVGRVTVLSGGGEPVDLDTLDGRENLAQALLLRLLIPRGSLAQLGHAGYGSRLSELIGQRKTEALRNLCRAYVLEVVQQEPRVEARAVDLQFDPDAETASTFVFTLAVQPRLGEEPVGLSLEIGL
jgi:phage baseplate assembly protein W